jgi:hypothetical protein
VCAGTTAECIASADNGRERKVARVGHLQALDDGVGSTTISDADIKVHRHKWAQITRRVIEAIMQRD